MRVNGAQHWLTQQKELAARALLAYKKKHRPVSDWQLHRCHLLQNVHGNGPQGHVHRVRYVSLHRTLAPRDLLPRPPCRPDSPLHTVTDGSRVTTQTDRQPSGRRCLLVLHEASKLTKMTRGTEQKNISVLLQGYQGWTANPSCLPTELPCFAPLSLSWASLASLMTRRWECGIHAATIIKHWHYHCSAC